MKEFPYSTHTTFDGSVQWAQHLVERKGASPPLFSRQSQVKQTLSFVDASALFPPSLPFSLTSFTHWWDPFRWITSFWSTPFIKLRG